MSSAGYIYVKNWRTRQHHKYESPPWHKVYNSTLRDDAYLALSHADRGLLQDLWSLASLSGDGRVSADPTFLARQLNVRRVSLDALLRLGFITVEAGRSPTRQTPESATDMRVSVSRTLLEMQPNDSRDTGRPRSDAGSSDETDTDRLRVGPESVTTEKEKSREDPLTPVNGGNGFHPETPQRLTRKQREQHEAEQKRLKAVIACRRVWRTAEEDGENMSALRESLERDYRHDPTIVTEAIGAR